MSQSQNPAARGLKLSGPAVHQDQLPPLQAISFEGREAINDLFEYRVLVQTPELPPGAPPWVLDGRLMLGREMTVHIELEGAGTFATGAAGALGKSGLGAGERQISGVVAEVLHRDADARHLALELVLRPGFWQATLGAHHHAFHGVTAVHAIDAVLAPHPWLIDKRLIETYPTLDRITQWGETDWRFCCRLMQQNGINFHFEHVGGTHRLVLSDHNGAFRPYGDEQGPYRLIPVFPPGHRTDREYIHSFSTRTALVGRSWEARDYDYTQPRLQLVASDGEPTGQASHARGEVYQWRSAGHTQGALWSQPNAGGDPQANTLARDHARWLARIRLEERLQHACRAEGAGNIRGIVTGCSFHLEGHHQPEANTGHLVRWTEISVRAPGQESQHAHAAGGWSIETRFATQPVNVSLRPELTLAKPLVHGPQPGIVAGPHQGKVHTDSLGRIKVWQPWQRHAARDGDASPWLRVAHPWSGNQQGSGFLPRVGQEVVVDHCGGDPDLPIVLAGVHNAMNLPGWQLPGQHALTGIRSRELTENGGNGAGGRSNHVVLDDSTGHIQAQIKSDHQHSSVSLGDIHRIDGNAGRQDARGQGAELRTDGHGAFRAALGMLLTTEGQAGGLGGMKDVTAALRLLGDASGRQDALAKTAQDHRVQDSGDQHAVQLQQERDAREIRGSGEALGEFRQPHLVINSAAGVQSVAATTTQQASGRHHAIVTGEHTSISAGGSVLASAARAIRLFAQKAGMRLFAAEGNVEVQAQEGCVDIRASDTIRIKARVIEIDVSQLATINGGGSFSRWEAAGVDHGTPGPWTVRSAGTQSSGPQSMPVPVVDLPRVPAYAEQFQAVNRNQGGVAVAGLPFKATVADGRTLEGHTDAHGRTPMFFGDAAELVEVHWGGLKRSELFSDQAGDDTPNC
ncbi:type VI secretion system Vgr family protein [Xylophilus sp. GOD-11R]|uniref:type VI secretion system Vgr family protein n=1 Tax=Xylophilus sp. GOD-11R TaxID=3089814 RepID=UPI00298D3638|nr:type VI secretion system tip protein TssI/VgrG [Xylophilus sp. GOD-11R]WPB58841.1 type VI secretion system tip protein TssI/VgrG [Xylophilus sp. GOD-11R]